MISALSGSLPPGVRVLVATRPVDFRRGADGLARTVQSILQQDPFSGTVFVFRSKRSDRVKLLVYDGTGLVLIWKRLEGAPCRVEVPGTRHLPLRSRHAAFLHRALVGGQGDRRSGLGRPV